MIYGIGVDLCEIARIEDSIARHGERFAERVLGTNELVVYRERLTHGGKRGVTYLATRFAAKEAFGKALGTGIRHPMTWQRCEVLSGDQGQPIIALNGELATWFESQGLRAHVSLSDETHHAAAYVVVEKL